MTVLVLGAGGMLGEAVVTALQERGEAVYGAMHRECDVTDADAVRRWLTGHRPTVIVNCAGVLSGAPTDSIEVNATGPRIVASEAAKIGARVIHVSTDCVFSGVQTDLLYSYTAPDPKDIYGITKYLGEARAQHVLNVRTSFIGARHGLLPWYRGESHPVHGFARWYWSGQTVAVVAQHLAEHVHTTENGTVHLATREPTTKLEILRLMQQATGGVSVVPAWQQYRNHALMPSLGWIMRPVTLEDIERAI